MGRNVAAVALIYVAIVVGWFALGGSVLIRTDQTNDRLHDEVSALWGAPQLQLSPELIFTWRESKTETEKVEDPVTHQSQLVTRERTVWQEQPVILDRSDIAVDLRMDHRRKGLLWYSTYAADFHGEFAYAHEDDREGFLVLTYRFPSTQASYDDFRFEVNGRLDPKMTPVSEGESKVIRERVPVSRGTTVPFEIGYRTRGLDTWRYSFGKDVNRVKNFKMAMTTDFRDIDFAQETISPTSKEAAARGWRLEWAFTNLISGFQIGMDMPAKINPGPLAARISFFAPVSLGFFFVWMFVITLLQKVELHPMNYLFLGAAFFAFHLLLSYTADHLELLPAFLLASGVSVFLVVSYLRLVVGLRFAALEAGISQLVYLVLFSYAHFLEGFTGLVITIGSILTLFVLMQLTGRIRWAERMRGAGGVLAAAGAPPSGGR